MKYFVATLAFSVVALGVRAQEIDQYLPDSGIIQGDVMVLSAPPELEELAQKIQASVSANAEWFAGYIDQNQDDALPYHQNLGVTEEEYDRFLRLSESGMSLQRAATVVIEFERNEDGDITFIVDPSDFPLHQVSISADEEYADTPYGQLARSSDVNQQDSSAPTGRWSGSRWMLEEISDDSARRIQLAIGKRDDFGDGIIYYDVIYQGDLAPEQYSFTILYPLQ